MHRKKPSVEYYRKVTKAMDNLFGEIDMSHKNERNLSDFERSIDDPYDPTCFNESVPESL